MGRKARGGVDGRGRVRRRWGQHGRDRRRRARGRWGVRAVTRARRIAGLALLAALAALSLFSARAHAGFYAVHSCMSSGDSRNASWYGVGSAPGTAPYAVCPAGEFHPYDTGLGARTTGGSSSRTPGFSGSWAQFDAPGGTSLHSMWFTGALGGQNEGGCWEAGVEAVSADFSSEHFAW